MIRASILFVAIASLAATGCKKKEEGAASSSSSPAAGKTAEAPKGGPTKLPKLGLQIDVPGSVEVGDALMGQGHMLQGSGIGAMQIEAAEKPQTLAEAKEDAGMYSPTNLKEETLPDGWALTYENTGGAGKNYFVAVRREIGGKQIHCSTTGSNPDQAAAVLAACKSLKP